MNTLTISNHDLRTGAVDVNLYRLFRYLGRIVIVDQGRNYRKVKGKEIYITKLDAKKRPDNSQLSGQTIRS